MTRSKEKDLSSNKFDLQVLIVSNAVWYDHSNGAIEIFLFISDFL